MKNLLKTFLIAITLMFTTNVMSQMTTIYQSGVDGNFTDAAWTLDIDCPTCPTQLLFGNPAYYATPSATDVFFGTATSDNYGYKYTANSTINLGIGTYTDIEVDLGFTELEGLSTDSIYLYTSNDGINWNLQGDWLVSSVVSTGTVTLNQPFTNSGDTYIRVTLSAEFNSSSTTMGDILNNFKVSADTSGGGVGISENDISNDFNVFSYNNNLVVKTTDFSPYTLTVFNMSGQMVMSESNSGQMESQLFVPSGIYIVNLTTENGMISKKVSLQ